MEYHENEVIFKLDSSLADKYELRDGYYEVEDFSVTADQDPDKYLAKKPYSIQKGKLIFKLGRKGSIYPAGWFNAYLKVNGANTFGYEASELNFAMIGTLNLELKKLKSHSTVLYTFPKIMLAQGHKNSRNTWWFASPEGKKSPAEYTITCTGKDSSGASRDFNFRRGPEGVISEPVNEITLSMV